MIRVCDDIYIPENELKFVASGPGGPGGQHANHVNTRITLLFDVKRSQSLSDEQKQTICDALSSRINRDGILRISCRESRSQWANREAATGRLVRLLKDALKTRRPRKKTRIPARARQRRLDAKKRRSAIKKERSSKMIHDY